MMGVCLSDQYLGTCLPPSITKHRWVDVLSHFSLLQQGCVAPGASQVFGHLVLQINPCRNLMLCAINSSYSAAWHVEQDFPPRAVAGRENGDKWVMEGDIFYFGCSDPGMKISALLPWWVLNWELHNSPATFCYTHGQNKWICGWDIHLWVRQVLNLSGSQFPKREERERRASGWRRDHSSLLDGQMCFQLCSEVLQNSANCWLCFQQTHRHCGTPGWCWMCFKPSCATSGAKSSCLFHEPASQPWELLFFQWLSHLWHLFHLCCTNPQMAQVKKDQNQQQKDFLDILGALFWQCNTVPLIILSLSKQITLYSLYFFGTDTLLFCRYWCTLLAHL